MFFLTPLALPWDPGLGSMCAQLTLKVPSEGALKHTSLPLFPQFIEIGKNIKNMNNVFKKLTFDFFIKCELLDERFYPR